jgi:hypothetical protein
MSRLDPLFWILIAAVLAVPSIFVFGWALSEVLK